MAPPAAARPDDAVSTAQIAHDIPGRLRVRLPDTAAAEAVRAAIGPLAGMRSVTWSPRTRSMLVLYEPETGTRDAIVAAITEASGLEAPPAADTPARVEPGAAVALGVRQLFGELDQRVQSATRGLVGLGGLFPVALTAWALAEVVRGRAAPLAWSSALWYAHGLFRDYQVPAERN